MKVNEQLAQLLGMPATAEWPHSETSLVEMINLQREKEITKQQYYKLENTNKSIELMNLSIGSQVPSYLIPIIFSGEALSEELIKKLSLQSIPPQRNTPIQQPPPSRTLYANFQNTHQPHHTAQPQPPQQPSSANLGPPVTFHRPLSPAKIGAAAVAQLDRGRYPPALSPTHKRNHSMPVHSNTPSLHSTPVPVVTLNSPSLRHASTNNYNYASAPKQQEHAHPQNQQSMMGTMSSIQFINENPGKKRRRASLDMREQVGEDQSIVEEDKEDKENNSDKTFKFPKRKSHTRTRSENFLWDKYGNSNSNDATPKKINQENNISKPSTSAASATTTVITPTEDSKPADTPKQGPKFANNILSSA